MKEKNKARQNLEDNHCFYCISRITFLWVCLLFVSACCSRRHTFPWNAFVSLTMMQCFLLPWCYFGSWTLCSQCIGCVLGPPSKCTGPASEPHLSSPQRPSIHSTWFFIFRLVQCFIIQCRSERLWHWRTSQIGFRGGAKQWEEDQYVDWQM